jgi:hypothetical protein
MLSVQRLKSRGVLVACCSVAAAIMAAGCSTVGPDTPNATGSLEGAVRSDRGGVPSMEVHLWCAGTTQSAGLEYCATTDESGEFDLADIDLGSPDAMSRTYEVYVNRTRDSASPVNDWYGTYNGAVSVERDPSGAVDFRVRWMGPTPLQPSGPLEP